MKNIRLTYLLISVITTITFLFSLTSLTSCEGYSCGKGIIYDRQTNEPLDSVLCKVLTGSEIQYSDSLGHYEVCNPFGGCVPDCPDIVVEFSKNGYKPKKATNPRDVFLEK